MAVGRRVLMGNAALFAAAAGCARRIGVPRQIAGSYDGALGHLHVAAADAPELKKPGGSVAVTAYPVLLANLGTEIRAFYGLCLHEFCPIAWVPEDRQVECPCHGSRFASDGTVLNPPATTDLPVFPIAFDPNGDMTIRIYPGDGTFPAPDANRKLVLDVTAYPQLANAGGSVFGNLEGPPGPLIVHRLSQTQFSALLAICTHQSCRVAAKSADVFHCPCHGSEFDGSGAVKVGPATRPLQSYATHFSDPLLTIDLNASS